MRRALPFDSLRLAEQTRLLVSPDFTGNSTGGAGNHSVVEWSSSGQSGIANCPAGTFAVVTFTFTGDTTDDNDGGGDSTGDSLQPDDEPFAFVVP